MTLCHRGSIAHTSSMWAFRAAARLLAAAAASRAAASAPCCASLFGERRRSRSLLRQPHKVSASRGEHPRRAARHSAAGTGTAVLSCDDGETLSQHEGVFNRPAWPQLLCGALRRTASTCIGHSR